MNKKLFKTFAAAAMSVLALACAKEQVGPGEGAMVEATFSVDVPGVDVSTKGLSDAASVNELICQVFLNDGNYTPVPDLNQTVEVKNKKAKVTFNLVKGQKYSFAFWAQVKGTGYYDTRDLRAVKMNVDAVKANDPAMDAYFAQKDFSALSTPVTDIKKNTVALYRAVAQVNFGTINSDRADKLEVVKSKIKLTEVPTVFDVVRGYKDDAYSVPATIEFKENVPVEEKLLVAGNEYDYLSTCYVFAYKDQKLTDATATFWVGSTSRTVSAPNAPYNPPKSPAPRRARRHQLFLSSGKRRSFLRPPARKFPVKNRQTAPEPANDREIGLGGKSLPTSNRFPISSPPSNSTEKNHREPVLPAPRQTSPGRLHTPPDAEKTSFPTPFPTFLLPRENW